MKPNPGAYGYINPTPFQAFLSKLGSRKLCCSWDDRLGEGPEPNTLSVTKQIQRTIPLETENYRIDEPQTVGRVRARTTQKVIVDSESEVDSNVLNF